ncbi:SLIT2 [Mytilus edulis]|uniref:SLIT2 n=1 Tax=Mytilus edulis TaxID=6550 RepID=A0A8S3Q7X9_MYTED|nr:SLIT2 [Mytilus edulis]
MQWCDTQCSCSDSSVDCAQRNLNEVPTYVPYSTTTLYLDENKIQRLEAYRFRGLTALTRLDLQHNCISSLGAYLFQMVPALEKLDLGYNQISSMYANAFRGLAALKTLDLNDNKITFLYVNLFHGLTALRELSLDNNKITRLNANLFRGLAALRFLFLYSNKISIFDKNQFRGLTVLESLYLHNNTIANLDVKLFQNLTALRQLSLHDNPFDCSTCHGSELKDFLLKNNNFGNSDARCDAKVELLIYHTFINCKEMTTIPNVDDVEQQPTLIGRSAESETIAEEVISSSTTTVKKAKTTESTTESTTGIMNTDVTNYSLLGVGIFLIISLSIVCYCAYEKYQKAYINRNLKKHQSTNPNDIEANTYDDGEIHRNNSTERASVHEYEEIEDQQTSGSLMLQSNRYLNPYQTLLPAPQQPYLQEDADGYSNPFEENRTYSNLYQSLQPRQTESNIYSRCHSVQPRQKESNIYARCHSVICLQFVDAPIRNKNVQSANVNIKLYRNTL